MKNYLFIFFTSVSLSLISVNVNAQYWWWPNHQLIPTQDKTSNLCLVNGNSAWEYQVDSATTAIYYRLIGSEPVCILSTPGVKYTNPKISEGWPHVWMFFETNINGSSDIYVIVIDEFGNPVGEMQPLVTSPANDHDFCYNLYCWQCQATWLEDETLKTGLLNQNNNQFTISDIETLDSLNCSSPVWFETLLWIKHNDFFDVIKSATHDVSGWTEPVNIDTALQIRGLKNTDWFYTLLQWTFKEDTTWFMKDYFYAPGYPNNYSIVPDIVSDEAFDFDVCHIGNGVKNTRSGGDNFFQAYVKNIDGFDEVFLNTDGNIDNYYNFSEMGANCRNPQFFTGEYAAPSTFFFYLTWEAFVDGSWQIYYSKTPITWGGIEENENSLIKNLAVTPNPFIDEFKISFDTEKPTSIIIELVDIYGRPIENIFSEKTDSGRFSKKINLSGNSFTGPCLVRFNIEGSYSSVKLIRTK